MSNNRGSIPQRGGAQPRRSAQGPPAPAYAQEDYDQHRAEQQHWRQSLPQQQQQQQRQWNDPQQHYQQPHRQYQQLAYAPQHYQQAPPHLPPHRFSHLPPRPQSYQDSVHLPSAPDPFHLTAPRQAQQHRYQDQSYFQNGGTDRSPQAQRGGDQGGHRDGRGQGRGAGGQQVFGRGNGDQGDHWGGNNGAGQGYGRRDAGSFHEAGRGGHHGGAQAPFTRHRQQASETPEPQSDSSALPTPFARRVKAPRATGAPPPPSEEYLASTLLPPTLVSAGEEYLPPLLILDLNNTLLCRKRGSTRGSKHPIVRPYLSTFLQYICGASEDGQRRWETAVYSSAASHNVLSLLEAIRLVPLDRAHEHETKSKGKPWDARPGEPLNLVWSREKMNLTAAEFTQNVETVKDLSQVWNALPLWDSTRSVLLDDEAMKAAQHPYNHIPIHPFIIDPASVPSSPAPSPRRLRSPDPRSRESTPQPLATASPTHLPAGHPFYDDTSLLSTIYVLDQLRHQANVGAWIRQIGLQGLDLQDEEQRVDAGREICDKLGIEVSRAWDEDWWAKTPSWSPSE